MAKYIDADVLEKELKEWLDLLTTPKERDEKLCVRRAIRMLRNQPAVEVEEVVHCKDCKYCHENVGAERYECTFFYLDVSADDFCSEGRKSND